MSGVHRVLRTFHSTCMISDYDATVQAMARLFDLRPLEYTEAEFIGRRGGMTWIGDNSIEVGQPIVEGHTAQRFVERFGPGMHSYAYEVEDLGATIAHLEAHGVTVGARPSPDFCFTDPRSTGGLLFEWAQMHIPEDPRFGAPLPAPSAQPILDVTSHAFVAAVHEDPIAWVEEFGPIFGLPEAFRTPDADAGRPTVGLAAPDCLLALYRLPGTDSRRLWGHQHDRARIHALGLGVPDLADAVARLATAGIPVLRADERYVVIEPAATGQVPVILVDDLLPGDPRREA
jgi:catechol 2,3-dioxygenase-like lactoylglutathione lyase family enzyme